MIVAHHSKGRARERVAEIKRGSRRRGSTCSTNCAAGSRVSRRRRMATTSPPAMRTSWITAAIVAARVRSTWALSQSSGAAMKPSKARILIVGRKTRPPRFRLPRHGKAPPSPCHNRVQGSGRFRTSRSTIRDRQNKDDRYPDERRRLRRPQRRDPRRRVACDPRLWLACLWHPPGHAWVLKRPVDYEALDLRAASCNVLRLGGTILGTTNKGDPFDFPMNDGTRKDRSAELIE